jgi:hypothetical protein
MKKEMTKSGVRVRVICPTCEREAEAGTRVDEAGILHPEPLVPSQLLLHCHCDIWELLKEISRRTFNESKVTTFSIFGGENDGLQ